ncbi:DUF4124 domain-containing protein [Undibacterium sp. Ji50W]|uniref:DUF4124 domain-containing protein n=1 Tax=Undibacterium sp. Ji50W TaxID=3413041 RepID=UPI003BF27599
MTDKLTPQTLMKISSPLSAFKLAIGMAVAALTMQVPLAQAEIYKWKDANGHTHYSENKQDAGNTKAEEVKVSTQAGTGSAQSWQEQELAFRQRQAARKSDNTRPSFNPGTKANTGNQVETDATRCAEARRLLPAIKEGRAYHRTISSGTKADDNDRMIAERDISLFCH